jgi:hypothetical protein
VWLDALERVHAKNETFFYLSYIPKGSDPKFAEQAASFRLEALEKAPRLQDWDQFCSHTPAYETAYAEELQRLLGPPFRVFWGFVHVPPKAPDYKNDSYCVFRISS